MCPETISSSPKEIKQASEKHLKPLLHLLDQANAYALKISGKLMWGNLKRAREVLQNELRSGNIFIINSAENVISSSITLSETSDEWGELGRDGKALYFMKLMKDPDTARPNEISELLLFVAREAKRREKTFVRCDTLSDDGGIIAYYKKIGFQEKGIFQYKQSARWGVLLEISSELMLHYIVA